MKLAFNEEGKLVCTGDAALDYEIDDSFTVTDSVDGVNEMWRYSYDVENSAIVVAYADMTDAEALAQLEIDAAAEQNAE